MSIEPWTKDPKKESRVSEIGAILQERMKPIAVFSIDEELEDINSLIGLMWI